MSVNENDMELLQLQIQQLKAMVREKDEILQSKDKELQEAVSKNSKLRLQAKAKAVKKSADVKKTHELQEKETPVGDSESTTSTQHVNRAEVILLKHKLEEKNRTLTEKDELIQIKDSQLQAKERVLAERDGLVSDLREQLEEKIKAMENMQSSYGGGSGEEVSQMYAQMVYKDRKILELNNKILEQDKRVMDLQEFAGEKDEVIRGRDRVVEILQNSIKEKEQNIQDQALLISKLTARVEATNEKVDLLTEELRQKEQALKSETERFHIKLTESQKYFEEMLSEMDSETKRLRLVIEEKSQELSQRESDLVQLIAKHESDIEVLLKKENINIQDKAVHMLENQLKDMNDVLEGKARAISLLQAENLEKEKELLDSREIQRLLKEKVQIKSEENLLLQSNFEEREKQWKDEKFRLETRMKDFIEKHEVELSEKDIQLENVRSTLLHYQTAYTKATEQYNRLQEHLSAHVGAEQVTDQEAKTSNDSGVVEAKSSGEDKANNKLIKVKAQMTHKIKALEKQLAETKQVQEHSVSEWQSKYEAMKAEMENKTASADQDRVKLLEEKITALEEEHSKLLTAVDQINLECYNKKQRIDLLEKENSDLKQEINDFSAIVKSQKEEINELQDKYSNTQGEIAITTRNFEKVTEDLVIKVAEVELLKSQLLSLEQEKVDFFKEKENLLEEVMSLRSHKEATSKEILLLQDKLTDACSLLNEKSLALSKSSSDMSQAMLQQLSDVQSELASKYQVLSQHEDTISDLRQQQSSAEEKLKQCQDSSDHEISLLKSQLNEEINSKSTVQQELDNLTDKYNELSKQYLDHVRQHEQEVENLRSFLDSVKTELNLAKDKISELESLLDVKDSEITTLTHDCDELQCKLQTLSIELESQISENNSLNDKLKQQSDMLATVSEESKDLIDKLNQSEQSVAFLQHKLQGLEDELSAAHLAATDGDSQLILLNAALLERQLQVDSLHTALQRLQADKDEQVRALVQSKQLDVSCLQASLDSLQTEQHALQTSFDSLTASHTQQSLHVQSLLDKCSMLETNLSLSNDKCHELSLTITSLKSSLSDSQLLCESYQNLKTEHADQFRSLQEEFNTTSEQVKHLSNSLEEKHKVLLSLEEKSKLLELELVQHKTQISHLTDSNSGLQHQLLSLDSESSDCISKLNEQILLMASELEQRNSQIIELILEINMIKCNNKDLVKELKSSQDLISILTSNLDKSHSDVLVLNEEVENLTKNLQVLKDELENQGKKFSELTSQLETERQATVQLKDELDLVKCVLESGDNTTQELRLLLKDRDTQLGIINQQFEDTSVLVVDLNSQVQSLITDKQELEKRNIEQLKEVEEMLKDVGAKVKCQVKDIALTLCKEEIAPKHEPYNNDMIEEKDESQNEALQREVNSSIMCLNESHPSQSDSWLYQHKSTLDHCIGNTLDELKNNIKIFKDHNYALHSDQEKLIQSLKCNCEEQKGVITSVTSSLYKLCSSNEHNLPADIFDACKYLEKLIASFTQQKQLLEHNTDSLARELEEVKNLVSINEEKWLEEKEQLTIDNASLVEEMAGLQFDLDKSLKLIHAKEEEMSQLQIMSLTKVTDREVKLEMELQCTEEKLKGAQDNVEKLLNENSSLSDEVKGLQSQVVGLKTTCKNLEDVNADLTNSLTVANGDSAGFEEALEAANKTIYRLESDNSQQQKYLDHLQSMLDNLQKEMKDTVESLHMSIEEKTQQVLVVEQKLKVRVSTVEEMKLDVENKTCLINSLEGELNGLKQNVNDLTEFINKLSSEKEQLESSVQMTTRELEKVSHALLQQQASCSHHEDVIKTLSIKCEEHVEVQSELKNQLEAFQVSNVNLQDQLAKSSITIDELYTRISVIHEELALKDNELHSCHVENHNMEIKIKELGEKKAELTEHIEKLSSKLDEVLVSKNETLTSKDTELKEIQIFLGEQLAAAQLEITSLEATIEEERQNIMVLQDMHLMKGTQLQTVNESLVSVTSMLDSSVANELSLIRLNKQSNDVIVKLQNIEKELELKNEDCTELEHKLTNTLTILQETKMNFESLLAENRQLKNDIAEVHLQCEKNAEDVDFLNKEKKKLLQISNKIESDFFDLKSQLNVKMEELSLLQSQCVELQVQKEELQVNSVKLRDEIVNLTNINDSLEKQISLLEIALRNTNIELEEKKQFLASLEDCKNENLVHLEEYKNIIKKLELEVSNSVNALKDSQLIANQLQAENVILDKKLQTLQSAVDFSHNKLSEAETNVAQLMQQEALLQEKIQTLNNEREMLKSCNDEQRLSLVALQHDLNSQNEKVTALEKCIESIKLEEKEMVELKSRLDLISSQLELKEHEVEHLMVERNQTEQTLSSLRSQVQSLCEEKRNIEEDKRVITDSMQNAACVLRFELESLTDEKERLIKISELKIQEMEDLNESLENTIKSLTEKLTEASVVHEEMQLREHEHISLIKQLQRDMSELEKENKCLCDEVKVAESKMIDLESMNNELNEKLNMSSSKLKDVTSHLQSTIDHLKSFVTEQSAIITVLQEESIKHQDTQESLLAVIAACKQDILIERKISLAISTEVDKLRQKNMSLTMEKSSLEVELSDMTVKFQQLTEEKSKIQKDLENALTQSLDAENKLTEELKCVDKLRQENMSLTMEKSSLEVELSDMTFKFQQLTEEKSKIQKDLENVLTQSFVAEDKVTEKLLYVEGELRFHMELLKEKDSSLIEVNEKLSSLREDFDKLLSEKVQEENENQAHILSLQKEITEIKELSNQTEVRCQEHLTKMLLSQNQVAILQEELDLTKTTLQQSEKENVRHKLQLSDLQNEVECRIKELFRFQSELSSCQQELKNSQKVVESLKEENKDLQGQTQLTFRTLQEENTLFEETIKNYSDEMAILKDSVTEKSDELIKLYSQQSLLASLVNDVNEKLLSAESCATLFQKQSFRDQSKLKIMETTVHTLEEKNANVLTECLLLKNQLKDFEEKLKEKDEEINSVKTSFLQQTTELKDLKDIFHEHKKSYGDTEKLITVLEAKHQEKDCLVRELSTQLRSSHQHVEAVQNELGESISEITRKGIMIRDLHSDIDSMIKVKEGIELEMSAMKEKNRELQMMVDILKEEKQKNDQTLSRNLEKVNTALFEERTKNGKLQKGLREFKNNLHKLMKERQHSEENLAKKAENLSLAISRRKTELDELCTALGKCKTIQENLQSCIASHLNQDAQTKACVEDTQQHLTEHKKSIDQVLEEYSLNRSDVQNIREELHSIKESCSQSSNSLSELQRLLQEEVEENNCLKKSFDDLSNSLKLMQNLVDASKEDLQLETKRYQALAKEMQESLKAQQSLQNEMNQIRLQFNEADERLKEQAASTDLLISELEKLSSQQTDSLQQCALEKENLETLFTQLQEQFVEEKLRSQSLQEQISKAIDDYQLMIETKDSVIDEIKQEATADKKLLVETQQKLNEANNFYQELSLELANLKEKTINSRADELSREEEMQVLLQKSLDEAIELRQQRDVLSFSSQLDQDKIIDLEGTLSVMLKDKLLLTDDIELLKAELLNLKTSINVMQGNSTVLEANIALENFSATFEEYTYKEQTQELNNESNNLRLTQEGDESTTVNSKSGFISALTDQNLYSEIVERDFDKQRTKISEEESTAMPENKLMSLCMDLIDSSKQLNSLLTDKHELTSEKLIILQELKIAYEKSLEKVNTLPQDFSSTEKLNFEFSSMPESLLKKGSNVQSSLPQEEAVEKHQFIANVSEGDSKADNFTTGVVLSDQLCKEKGSARETIKESEVFQELVHLTLAQNISLDTLKSIVNHLQEMLLAKEKESSVSQPVLILSNQEICNQTPADQVVPLLSVNPTLPLTSKSSPFILTSGSNVVCYPQVISESQLGHIDEHLTQLQPECEQLKTRCAYLESIIEQLNSDLLKEHTSKVDLEKSVKKKEKIIQGLNLKLKRCKPRVNEKDAIIQTEEDIFFSMPWSADLSELTNEQKEFKQLLHQYQKVIIERDALKEILQEKDSEIVRLQACHYDAELLIKDLQEKLKQESSLLHEKFEQEATLKAKEEILEKELKLATSELWSKSQILDDTRKSSSDHSWLLGELQEKLLKSQEQNTNYKQQLVYLENSLEQKTKEIAQLHEDISSKQIYLQVQENETASVKTANHMEMEKLQFEIKNLESHVNHLKDTVRVYEKNSQADRMPCQGCHEVQAQQDEIVRLKLELKEKDEKINIMENMLKELYGQQEESSILLDKLKTGLEESQILVVKLQSEKDELNKTLKKKNAKILALTKRVTSSTPKKMAPPDSPKSSTPYLEFEMEHDQEVQMLKAELTGMRKLMKKKDTELSGLKKKCETLPTEQSRLSSTASIESVVSCDDDRLRLLEKQKESLESHIRELEIDLDNSKEELTNLRHDCEDLQEEVHLLSRDKRALENCVYDIRDMVNSNAVEEFSGEDLLYSTAESVRLMVEEKYKADHDHLYLQGLISKLEQDLSQETGLLNEAKSHILQLESELQIVNESHKELQSHLDKNIAEKTVLQEQIAIIEKRHLGEIKRFSNMEAEMDALNESRELLHLEHLKASVQKQSSQKFISQIEELSKELNQTILDKEKLIQQLSSCNETIQHYQMTQVSSENYVIQLLDKMKESDNLYSQRLEECKEKEQHLEQELVVLKENVSHQQYVISDLESKNVTLSAQLSEYESKISELRTMVKNKEAKILSVTTSCDELAVQYEKLQNQLLKADHETSVLKDQVHQQKNLMEWQENEILKLNEFLQHAAQQAELNEQLNRLQEMFDNERKGKDDLYQENVYLSQQVTSMSQLRSSLESELHQYKEVHHSYNQFLLELTHILGKETFFEESNFLTNVTDIKLEILNLQEISNFVKELQEKISLLEKELLLKSESFATLEANLKASYADQIKNLECSVNSLRQEISSKENNAELLQQQLNDHRELYSQLEQSFDQLQQEHHFLTLERSEKELSFKTLLEEKTIKEENLETVLVEYKKKLTLSENEIISLQQQLSNTNEMCGRISETLAQEQNKLSHCMQELQEKDSQIMTLTGMIDEVRADKFKQSESINNQSDEHQQLQKEAVATLDLLKVEREALQQQVAEPTSRQENSENYLNPNANIWNEQTSPQTQLDEIIRLQAWVDYLQNELTTSQYSLQLSQSEINMLKDTLSKLPHQIVIEDSEGPAMEQKYKCVEEQLEASCGQISTLTQNLAAVTNEAEHLKKINLKLEAQMSSTNLEMSVDLQSAQSELLECHMSLKRAVEEKSAFAAEVSKVLEEKSTLECDISKVFEKMSAYEIEVSKVMNEKSALEFEVSRVLEEKSMLESEISKVVGEKSALEFNISRILEEKAALESELSKVAGEKSSLELDISKILDEKSNLDLNTSRVLEEKSALESKVSRVLEEKSTLGSEFSRILEEKSVLESELSRLESDISLSKSTEVKIQELLDAEVMSRVACEKALAQSQMEKKSLEENIVQLTAQIMELTDELKHTSQDLVSARDQVKVASNLIQTLQSSSSQKEQETVSELLVKTEQVVSFMRQLEVLEMDKEKLSSDLMQSEAKVDELQHQVKGLLAIEFLGYSSEDLTIEDLVARVKDVLLELTNEKQAICEEKIRLENEMGAMLSNVTLLQQQVSELEGEKDRFCKAVQNQSKILEEFESKCIELNQEKTEAQSTLHDMEEKCQEIQHDCDRLLQENNRLKEMEEQLKMLQISRQSELEDSSNNESRLKDLKKGNSELQTLIQEKTEELEALAASQNKSTEELQTLLKSASEKDIKIQFLLENMQEMEGRLLQVEEMQAQHQLANSQIEDLKKKLEEKDKAFEEKNLIAKKALATAKKLKFQLTQANKNLEDAKKQMGQFVDDKQKVENQLSQDVLKDSETVGLDRAASLQAEIDTYKECCQQLQQQVQALTETVFHNESTIKKYHKEMEQLEGFKVRISELELSNQQEQHKAHADHLASMEDVQQQCSAYEELCGQLKSMVDSLEQELQSKTLRLEEIYKDCQQLHDENITLKVGLEDREEKLNRMLSDVEFIKGLLSKEVVSVESFRQLVESVEETLPNVQLLKSVFYLLDGWTERISELEECLTKQKEENENKEQSLQTEINSLQVVIKEGKTDLLEMTALVNSMQKANNDLQSQLENLLKEHEEKKNHICELNQTVVSLRTQVEELESISEAEKMEEVVRLQAALKEQRVIIESLQENMSSKESEGLKLDKYKTRVEKLNEELMNLKSRELAACEEREEWHVKYDQVVQENGDLRKQLGDQLELVKMTQDMVSEKQEQVQNVHVAYEHLQADVAALMREKEQLVASVESMKGEIEGLEQILAQTRLVESETQAELKKLQAERDQLKHELNRVSQILESKPVVQHSMVERIEKESLQRSSEDRHRPTEASLEEVQNLYEKTKSRLQVAEVKCEKMLVKLKAFKDKNDKLQLQTDELQQKLAFQGDSPVIESNLRDERRRLEEQVNALNTKLRQIETHNGQLIHDNSCIKAQLKEKEIEVNQCQNSLDTLSAQCLQLETLVDNLKQQLSDSETSTELSIRLAQMKGERDEQIQKIEDLGKSLQAETQTKMKLSQEISKLQQELETNKTEASLTLGVELDKVKDAINLETSNLRQQLEAKVAECNLMIQERNNEHIQNLAIQAGLYQLEENISMLKSQLDSAKDTEKNLMDVKEALRSCQSKLAEKEAVESAELDLLTDQLQTLQSQYDSLSKDNDHYQSLVTTLTSNNAALKKEVDQLRFKLKQLDAVDSSSTEDIKQQLQAAEQERDELREEFEGVREELISLRRDKLSWTQQVEELSKTVEHLNSRLLESPSVDKDDSDLMAELTNAADTNQQLERKIQAMEWKLEEMSSLEQEVEELHNELSSCNMEKKILSHDLEEVRGEMSALQTDKHLLMKEVERLSEVVQGQERGSGDIQVQRSMSEELLQTLAAKDAEMSTIQSVLDEKLKDMTVSLKEIQIKDELITSKDQQISSLDTEIQNMQVNLKELEMKNSLLKEELESSQAEVKLLTKRMEHFNVKLDTVKSLEADFDSLNADFNKVLEEKREMAREIEELHSRIAELMSQQQEKMFKREHQEHVLREKETLQRRVDELEHTGDNVLTENTKLKEDLVKTVSALQKAEFDRARLDSQLDSLRRDGAAEGEGEHTKLQAQFYKMMEEKNALVAQLNEAHHTLKQREARCQQLALQVSQLAEDRGYLNTQLANISKSLREKEQEWLAIRQQYGELYQTYIAVQSKNAELERRIALDCVQKEIEEEETAAEADQARGQTDQALKRIEELQALYNQLRESHDSVSTSLRSESTLREQLERQLGEAQEQIKLLASGSSREVYLQLEEDNDLRIRETSTMLTRHGLGYCSRLNSWLKVKNRQLTRVMRLRPGLRTVIWIYFAFIHLLMIACFGGLL